ncbi:MAG: AI-2E family transporter, partial [Leptospiraceae bacterium]|nr:AI-2E family transporter [Leptospiraceae bacterium]
MITSNRNIYYVLVLLSLFFIAAASFVFIVYKSFFWSGFISLIFYLGSRDFYIKFRKKIPEKIKNSAPILMIILLLVTIVLPLFFISATLIKEFLSLLLMLKVNLTEEKILPFLLNFTFITDYITDSEFFWVQLPAMYREIVSSYGDILNIDSLYGILSNATSLVVGGLKVPIELIVTALFTFALLFFLYKDGHKLERFLMNNLPLSQEIKIKIGYRILDAVKVVFQGNLVISIIQGAILGLLLFFTGIPNAVLYGAIGSFFSLIPIIGTGFIWLPAGLYLGFSENNWLVAIVFMSISYAAYLILENLVKPGILDKKLNIHPFLLFLALLGGIKEFGI